MKLFSKETLKTIIISVMGTEGWEIRIIKNTEKELLFEATHMYDWKPYTPTKTQMNKFEEIFGTENIDKYDDISIPGCDTCDYGSSYGFALRVWD